MKQDQQFIFERTFDIDEAEFDEWRVSRMSIKGIPNLPKSDEEILKTIRQRKLDSQWYTTSDWINKGIPQQLLRIKVGSEEIVIYNYLCQLSRMHIHAILRVINLMGSKFPKALKNVDYILINNDQPSSHLGDATLYPSNGMSYQHWRVFELYPRCFESIAYRIPPVSNLVGVMSHEFTHSIQDIFLEEWKAKFQWRNCRDAPEEWEMRSSPNDHWERYFHVTTGEMSPQGQFALQPEQCVSHYAKQNCDEDICESMVAYLYNPKLLKRISPEKYRIIAKHDAGLPAPDVSITIVPNGEETLPEPKTRIVKYYIHED